MVPRRRLLTAGALAFGLGGILAWRTSGYRLPASIASRLRALSPREYLIVEAAAARIVRSDHPGDPTASDVGAAAFIDRFVAALDPAQRTDVRRLLHLLEQVLPFAAGHLSRFTRLGGEAQDEVLAAMMTSRIGVVRGAFESLKTLAVMAYYRDPRTWPAIGYDGPLRDRLGGTGGAT